MVGLDASSPPELWGGIECTVNRVGDRQFDQLEMSGHDRRIDDLDRIAGLGVRTLRYPLLWERTARLGPRHYDWTWADARLGRMQALGLSPIVGLVHHGSGPLWTSLVSDDFPQQLADYAAAVAARFPHVTRYTPINEPLTTARFSGLYGHWYPHGADDRTFVRALLIQCRAIVLAARAIREVTPGAELIATEDVGRTFSRAGTRWQGDFYNERRWLSFDLLCGRVTPDHRLWGYLRRSGATVKELDFFLATPTPPDVLGINYYVTSDRYLDDRLETYSPSLHHRGARGTFVDIEAVRSRHGISGYRSIIDEVWRRYASRMAITEVHMGCTRDEQLRWLIGAWQAGCEARDSGLPLRAVTAWALLGSFDWDTLVTEPNGRYEPGAFDVRHDRCRPTALAGALKSLATGRIPQHPASQGDGWWCRRPRPSASGAGERRGILISGATGRVGRAFARACGERGLAHCLLSRRDMDIADRDAVRRAIEEWRPWAIINASGYRRIDAAEADVARCWRENVDGAAVLAEAATRHQIPFVTFSSDLVFDGRAGRPYVEGDRVRPLSVYGESHAAAEAAVLGTCGAALVIRTAGLFGPDSADDIVTSAVQTLAAGQPYAVADDLTVSPTYLPDLVTTTLDLLIDGETGLWHLTNQGEASWATVVRAAAERLGLDPDLLRPCAAIELPHAAPRPRYSALASERGAQLRPLGDALDSYARDFKSGIPQAAA